MTREEATMKFQLEMLSYAENIALAELEAAKAAERVKQIVYEKERFIKQWNYNFLKVQQDGEKTPPTA